MKPLVGFLSLVCLPLGLTGTLLVGTARAADPTTADCLAASESSLNARNQHKLRDARTQLLVCAATSCPADVRAECVRRVGEVNVAMPTIVFEFKDTAGNDLSGVRVMMDGALLVERLEGTALSIDPGHHAFAFEAAGQPAVRRDLVIREGEKERRERVLFGAPALALTPGELPGGRAPDAAVAQASAATQPAAAGRGPLGARRVAALASAGVGVVGIGLGVGYGLAAFSRHDEAARACPGQCTNAHDAALWDSARSAGTVSTVAFVVGAAGLAGGAALWFLGKPETSTTPVTQVGLGPGTLQLKGTW